MQLSTFNYLSLLDWCRQVETGADLVRSPNSFLIYEKSFRDFFGRPDVYFPSDEATVEAFGSENPWVSEFTTVTQGFHTCISEVFAARLDDVVLQRVSLGRERYHIFLRPGIAAAESYNAKEICEKLSEISREIVTMRTGEHEIRAKVYDDIPVDQWVDQPCVLISHMWMHNYAHWILEVLPRLWYMDAIPELRELPVVVPTYPPGSFYEQTLQALIGNRPRIALPGKAIRFRQLYFSSFRAPGAYSRRQIEWINDKLRPALGVAATSGAKRRIYITREDARVRRVSNETAVMAELEARGFVKQRFSNLSVREQIELMSSAEAIVLPHGAGCANLVFAPEGARVVELMPESSVHPMYGMIAKLRGLRYGRLLCPDRGPDHALDVAIDKLGHALDCLGVGRAR